LVSWKAYVSDSYFEALPTCGFPARSGETGLMQGDQETKLAVLRLLVADDTRIHTQLLASALERDKQFQVLAAGPHSQDVLKCAGGDSFEVAVISSNLDGPLTGFDVLRQLRVLNSCLRGIMLLDSSRREVVLEAFRAGARGIFSRHESIETLSKCIRSVYHGQIWANSQQMSYAVEALSSVPVLRAVDSNGLSLLSERELEVVRSLAEG